MEDIYIGDDNSVVKFEHNQVVVGCTTISLDDVRKIAKQAEIECVKPEPKAKWKMVNTTGEYMLYGEQVFEGNRNYDFLSDYGCVHNGKVDCIYSSGGFSFDEIISLERLNDE